MNGIRAIASTQSGVKMKTIRELGRAIQHFAMNVPSFSRSRSREEIALDFIRSTSNPPLLTTFLHEIEWMQVTRAGTAQF